MVAILIVAAGPPIDAFTLQGSWMVGAFEAIIKIDVATDHIGGDHRPLRLRPRRLRPLFKRASACI